MKHIGFVHVPRTAGGSVVNELMKTDCIILGHEVNSPNYMHIAEFRKFHPQKDSYLFATVRNPYDRLVSAYHYLQKGGDNSQDKADAERYVLPFKSFEAFVLQSFKWNVLRKTTKQIHFIPQHFWLTKRKKILVNHLYNFENLSELFIFLEKEFDIKKVGHTHLSKHSAFEGYYSKKMKTLAYKAYEKDFKLFNYPH